MNEQNGTACDISDLALQQLVPPSLGVSGYAGSDIRFVIIRPSIDMQT
jgi:hypothetical protein